MKNKSLIFLMLFILVSILIVLFYSFTQSTLHIDKQNNQMSKLTIAKDLDITTTDIRYIQYDESTTCLYVLYQSGGYTSLQIYKSNSLFKNYFTHYGASSSASKAINAYTSLSETAGTVVIFGDNTILNADRYSFVNSGKEYTKEIEQEYFIHIYMINEMTDIETSGYIYDVNGDIISML